MSRFTRSFPSCNSNTEYIRQLSELFNIPIDCKKQWNILQEVELPATVAADSQQQQADSDADNSSTAVIETSKSSLICVHYDEEIRPSELHPNVKKLRGQIVDTSCWKVVAGSSGAFTPMTVLEPVTWDDEAQSYQVQTDEGIKTLSSQAKFNLGFESAKIRIFDHKGHRYFATYKNITAEKALWGGKSFHELFCKHLKPEDIVMPVSTVTGQLVSCLTFLLLDPHLCLSTSYVAEKLLLLPSMVNGRSEESDDSSSVDNKSVDELPSRDDFLPNIERCNPVPLQTANDWIYPRLECIKPDAEEGTFARQLFLSKSESGELKVECNPFFFNPEYTMPEMLAGDFIVVQDGSNFYRLNTRRIKFTTAITGEDSYPYHHFCLEAKKHVKSVETLVGLPQYMQADGVQFDLNNYQQRVKLWTVIVWDAMSPARKPEVLSWCDRFFSELEAVAHFVAYVYPSIAHNMANYSKLFDKTDVRNLERIHSRSKGTAVKQHAAAGGRAAGAKGKGKGDKKANSKIKAEVADFNVTFKAVILNWLTFNETSDSCYKLMTAVRRYTKHSTSPTSASGPASASAEAEAQVEAGEQPVAIATASA